MEKSSFFDAEIVNGEYDRVYLSEDYAKYFSSFIGNGIFPNPSDNLRVVANGDSMKVTVKAGKAWIKGYYYENDSDLVLNLEPADGVLHRIDRIVVRLDLIEREVSVKIKQGAFSSNPVAEELERNVDIYELALADIKIMNGNISITNSNINDLRLNSEFCGIVHGTVDQVDTTEIFNTYQQYLNEKLNGSEFNDWFMLLKNKLDPYADVALQLQLQISELEEKMENSLKTDGSLQENLNADMLDGKHANEFIQNGQSQAALKSIELCDAKPYIDFHFNNSTNDFTSRIIEETSGTLTISNNLKVSGKINDKQISGTLATNEKTNLITAINEVFTNANNGKTAIANVVGSPLTANNTFQQAANTIQSHKNTLATNLKNKGISADSTETLANLVGKVGNIQSIKYVSGYAEIKLEPAKTSGGVTTGTVYDLNFGFRPDIYVQILYSNSNANKIAIGFFMDNELDDNGKYNGTDFKFQKTSTGIRYINMDTRYWFQPIGDYFAIKL
ncbi:hypothetical protein [Clostridium botulinum]|uniref:hypothetical protein n=1 Tax=Clostridium botulinum TaxID=1491 RepID=UPI0006A6FCF9|nr:hypothetical protein [Clostridium botulinum]KAI3350155.1 hypothetical protein CIT18_04560 [Clostridium botulinum]MCS6111551.1 hypothetical protein [Clostridium botulinum]NFE10971.1 hypothetical protein [Clostridium botulinum]NFR79689.1 hypothetical protein [Clostridium botulinum]